MKLLDEEAETIEELKAKIEDLQERLFAAYYRADRLVYDINNLKRVIK